MESIPENVPKMEGELSLREQLQEQYDSLQIKILEAPTDEERDQLVEQANEIERQIGLEEGKTEDQIAA